MTTSIPEDQVIYKLCKKCGKEYPATPEHFPLDGRYLKSPCRPCRRAHDRERRSDPEKKARDSITAKKYREVHREEYLHKQRIKDTARREQRRQYYLAHREKILDQVRHNGQKYRAKHREELRRKRRFYDANRAELRKQRYELHREEILAYHRHYNLTHQEQKRRYQQLHREQGRIRAHKRRARKRASHQHHTVQQIREQYARQRGRCYYCTQKVKWGDHHIEHVIPLSRGGSNDISNIVISCAPCNLSKGSKLPHEWGKRLL